MRFFTYDGYSCATALDMEQPLILASFDGGVEEVHGSTREIISGETGIYKTVANEYGNKYSDTLSFEYGLMKASGEVITKDEQEAIETWLTSPKLSQYLELYDAECDEDGGIVAESATPVAIYCGTFTDTSWLPYEDGYMGVKFTFRCDQPYAWQFYDFTFKRLSGDISKTIFIETDARDDYVYPKIQLTATNNETPTKPVELTITNVADDNRSLTIKALSKLTINMDCRALRLTDNVGNVLRYDDLGWADVGNIYWPRFCYGRNQIDFSIPEKATLDIKISYMSPRKIVGGWL